MSSVSKLDEAPPALYLHCVSTYKEMLSTARMIVVNEGSIAVWEGMLVQLVTGKLHLSIPYYTSVTRALKRMGCVTQLKRGGGVAASQWELHYEPTIEMFNSAQPKKEIKQDKYALLQGQFDSLNTRVLVLEAALQNLITEEIQTAQQLALDEQEEDND